MMRRPTILLALTLLLPAAGGDAATASADGRYAAPSGGGAVGELGRCHQRWSRVVSRHAVDGGVDYAAVAADRGDLDAFVACIGRIDPARLAEADRLAFLTNAYNALVVAAVLERYPGIGSVREVDGFFDRETHRVGGRSMTLDEIEAVAREIDARVHFAVVCASHSCPDLPAEPLRGAAIDRQLRQLTHGFLADRDKGLRYDRRSNTLHLSSIFKWYAGDFTGGSTVVAFFARGGVLDWVIDHLGDRRLAAELAERRPSVAYLDYDWSLNDR